MTHARFCPARLLARALGAANFLRRHTQDAAQMRAILADQGWRPAPIRFVVSVLVIAYAGLVGTDVQAHPHVWVTMTTELVYAPNGSATAVHHAWTFDDMFSTFATQGLEQKTKGQFTREELAPLAKVNVESLQEYAYFTYVKVDGKQQKDALSDPVDYYLEYDPKETVLTLHFTLPFKTPVKAKALDVEVYDPEFFIDFGFAEKDQVRLVNAPAQCFVSVAKPHDDFFSAAVRLDKSMAWEANAGLGANFANRISANCP
jgi:ABC-type uncharacterized transport system substrate-binding protein